MPRTQPSAPRVARSSALAPPSFSPTHAAHAAQALGYRVGEVVAGKYELVRLLGHGGMGAVWAVRNLIIDAEFALKMLRNEGNEGETHALERMLREARSAARIEHPAIVRVFDFGVTERGDAFLVMDLLQGTTVHDILVNEGPMSPLRAVRLLLPIADALSVAHSRDIVHRDVKADNIMVVPDGPGRVLPTLVDFGIAKQLRTETERLTLAGTVIGSPEYMSPEQARGLADVDQATDIWSLSIVLYEMVTGQTPFHRAGSIASTLHAIIDEAATPLVAHGVDEPELQAILDRGLSKFPGGRFADMRALGTALARFLLSRGVEEDASAQSIRAVWFGTQASAPPVALDVGDARDVGDVRRRDPLPVLVPGEYFATPTRRGVGWAVAGLVSVLVVAGAIGAGFYARHALRQSEDDLARAAGPKGEELLPQQRPDVDRQAVTAALLPPATASEPAVSAVAEPPAPAPAASRATVAEDEPGPSRQAVRNGPERARSVDPAPPRPAPRGIDVTDLPGVFVPPSPEPSVSAPPAASAPRGETAPEAPRDDPKPSDLREPYPSDNPY